MGSVTPEKAIEFARLSVALTFCWPLSPQTTESQLIRFKIFRSILLLNAFILSLPLAYSLYIFRDDFVNFSKSIWILLAIVQILMNTSVCISQYDRFQELIEEMKKCCKNAKYSERCIYQKYVDEYSSFYGGSAILFYATALIVATGTLFISQPFPTIAEYPFSVNYEPLRSIIFLHQTVVGLQCSAQRLANRMEQFFVTTAGVSLTRPTTVSYVLTTTFFVGNLLYSAVPLFTNKQETPISTVYFTLPREKHWGRSIIYTLNVVQIISVASFLFLDMLIIFIIWHAACQFHLLANRFTLSNEKKLKSWIKEHQDALRHANEINSVIAPLAVKSTLAVALNIIIAGLVVTNRKLNMVELSKFFTVTAFSMLRFFACTWIAGTMTENAQNITQRIYDSPWIYSNPRIRKLAVLVMHRCQKPVAIHWPGIVSAWTLRFYNQVLYKIITYLMTLRAVIRV